MIDKIQSLKSRYGDMAGDVAWSGIADLLTIIAQTASFILLGRNLGPDRYGGYVGMFGIIGPLGALSWSGLTLLVMQQILGQRHEPNIVARNALTLLIAQTAAASVVSVTLASLVIKGLSMTEIVLLTLVELAAAPVVAITAGIRQAVEGFPQAARMRIGLVLSRSLSLVALYLGGALTIQNLAITWMIVISLYSLYCLTIVWPRLGLSPIPGRPSRSMLTANGQLSLPMASAALQQNGDKAVLNGFNFTTDAGLYGAAFRIILMAQLPVQTMNTALFHRFLGDDKARVGQHTRRAVRFSFVSFLASVPIAIAIWIVAPVLSVILGDDFAGSVNMVRWLAPFIPLLAVSAAPLNGLLGLNKNGVRAAVVISSSVLAMTLYLSLVPALSWRGAAIGTLVAQCYVAGAGWYLLIKTERAVDADRGHIAPEPAAAS